MNPFIGMITMFAGNFAPRDWAFCSGQLLAISQNTALFSILGTTYGGDGQTTFALPDLRGRFAMHPGNGPGLTPRQLGQKGGNENTTLTAANMPNHSHPTSVAVSSETGEEPTSTTFLSSHAGAFNEDTNPGAFLEGVTSGAVGNNQSYSNTQPFTCVNYIIALFGTFPSRN